MRAFVIGSLLLLAPFITWAQTTCYQYRYSTGGGGAWDSGWLDEPLAVCQAIRDHDAPGWTSLTVTSFDPGGAFPAGGGTCRFQANGSIPLSNGDIQWRVNPTGCPLEDCSAWEGASSFSRMREGFGPAETCNADSGCMATRQRATCLGDNPETSDCLVTYTLTGEACESSEGQEEADFFEGAAEGCISGSAGEFCQSELTNGENCGYLNDQFICVGQTGNDNCNVMADGSRVCGTQAPMPPVPDNGTPGTRATPDGQLVVQNGNTYNFYSSTTVGGSSRDPGTTGENPYNGSAPGGSGDGEGEGDDEFENPGSLTVPDMGEYEEPGAVLSGAWETMQEAPIVLALSVVGYSFPAGVCPTATISPFGEALEIDAHCEIVEGISGILAAVCIFGWAIVGYRIVGSA